MEKETPKDPGKELPKINLYSKNKVLIDIENCVFMQFRLDVPSGFGHIDMTEAVLNSVMREKGFDEESVYYMGVCLREAMVNAHKYANKFDPSKRIGVDISYCDDRITVAIEDEGTDIFDMEQHFELKKDLLMCSSRGIYLMKQLTSEDPQVEYITKDDQITGKRIKLVKYLQGTDVPTSSR